jgi:hypothetical protein
MNMKTTTKQTMAIVAVLLLSSTGESSLFAQIHQLTFPEGMTGSVYLAQPPERENGFIHFSFDDDKRLRPAQGTVRVSAKLPIRLDITPASPDDLAFLSDLPADCIQQLLIRDTSLDRTALQHVASQRSLQYLFLSGKFTEDAFEDIAPLRELLSLRVLRERAVPPETELNDPHLADWIADCKKLEDFYSRPSLGASNFKQLRGHSALRFVHVTLNENCAELVAHLHELPMLGGLNVTVGEKADALAVRELDWPPRIEGFNWSGGMVDAQFLRKLSRLEKLRFLRFYGVDFADNFEAGLPELRSLEQLHFQPADFGKWRNAMSNLSPALLQLPRLRMWPTLFDVDAETLRMISQQKQIEALEISGVAADVGSDDLKQLGQLTQLRYLELSGIPLDDDGLQAFASANQLEIVRLYGTKVTGSGFKALQGLDALEHISIAFPVAVEPTLDEMCGLPRLKSLSLSGNQLQPKHFSGLGKCQQLTSLSLDPAHVDDSVAEVISGLTNLESLSIRGEKGFQITDRGLQSLSQIPKLHTINIDGQFTPEGVAFLAKMPSLRSVYLVLPVEATNEVKEQMHEVLKSIPSVRIVLTAAR